MPSYAVRKPIPILMIYLAISLFGIYSIFQLPIELMPNAAFNKITILVNVRGGMPPEDVEFLITKPIEDAISTVTNLESLGSTSKEGKATIVLSFAPGIDMDFASLEVREKFAKVKNKLPREAEKPVIAKYEENDQPVLVLAISSFLEWFSTEEVRKIVDERIKERLSRVQGVANVEISGGRESKYIVEADLAKIQSMAMPMQKVISAISRNNLNLAVGDIDKAEKDILVRTQGQFPDMESIAEVGITKTETNSLIRVKDVATVKDDYVEATSQSRTNSKDVVSIYVQKESTGNTIEIVAEVLKEVEDIKKTLESHFRMIVTSNQATFIQQAIDNVNSSLVSGALLAILVLLVFLRDIRSTLVIGVSVPLSFVGTFGLMYLFYHFFGVSGLTLNVMSLSGLALGGGQLVDNSVVVLEKVFGLRDEGMDAITASIEGPQKESMAIFGSTLTTLIVFLPILFINKQIQILYSGLALTVAFSLIMSLFVSLTVTPLLVSRSRMRKKKVAKKSELMVKVKKQYRGILYFFIQYRYITLFAMLLLSWMAVRILSTIDQELLGSTESTKFTVFVELPAGAKIEISDKVVKEVEAVIANMPEVSTYSSRIEGWSSKVFVDVLPTDAMKKKTGTIKEVSEIIDDLRPKLKGIGEGDKAFIYFAEDSAGGGNTELLVDVYGFDYEVLKKLANEIAGKMAEVEGVQDVKLRMKEGRPEMLMVVDKKMASLYDLTTQDIADELHAQIRGLEATRFHKKGGQEIEVVARLQKKDRAKLVDVKKTTVVNKRGEVIPIRALMDFKDGIGPSEIWRLNKSRMIEVSGSSKVSLDKAIVRMRKKMEEVKFPKDYYYLFGGDYEKMIENQKQLSFALILMVLIIYMVLACLFESYIQPIIIMAAVPLSAIGMALALKWTDTTITMGVMIGAIMLGGIVVNNSIMLIDNMNELAGDGMGVLRRAVTSSVDRTRPIVMTITTNILGFMPMAVSKSQGSSLWAPLAITLIGGLVSSTILTLLILPSIYVIFDEITNAPKKFMQLFSRFRKLEVTEPAST